MIKTTKNSKITDSFGESLEKSEAPEQTEEAKIVGTPYYMAPEMLDGKGLDQPAIDYWALGVICFELLVGYPPFLSNDLNEIFDLIRKRKIPWEELQSPDDEEEDEDVISPEAKDLINGLLTLDPANRLGSDSVDNIKRHPFFKGSIP